MKKVHVYMFVLLKLLFFFFSMFLIYYYPYLQYTTLFIFELLSI